MNTTTDDYKQPPTFDMSNGKIAEKEQEAEDLQQGEEIVDNYDNMDKLSVPEFEKNKGKEAYLRGDYSAAVKHYSKSLLALQFLIKDQKITKKEDLARFIDEIEIPGNSNLAMCNLKLKEYGQCKHFATKVIDMDPKNVKALYRRGMAHMHMNEFTQARDDFKAAHEIDGSNKEIASAFQQLQERQAKVQKKQQDFSKKLLQSLDYSDMVKQAEEENAAAKKRAEEEAIKNQMEALKKEAEAQEKSKKSPLESVSISSQISTFFSDALKFIQKPFGLCKRRAPSQKKKSA